MLSQEHVALLVDMRRRLSEPPSRLPISEWCEASVIIPPPQTQSPGPLSWVGREYLVEPLDSCNVPGVTDVVLCFGSQSGKTTMLQALIVWLCSMDPSPILWVMPSESLAQSFSETRLIPVLRHTPVTAALIPAGRDRHAFKTLQMQLGGAVINLVGSNSPANLASRPVRVAVLDEVDKFDNGGREEADAVSLAEQRTKSFARPLRVKTSTPTLSDGLIWQEYMKGDQRRFFVPCPHCGRHVILSWSREYTVLPICGAEAWIRWDKEARRPDGSWDEERVMRSTRAECPHCGVHIQDASKTAMLRGGEWRPTAAATRGFRSYHLSSLYAAGPQTSWGALAVQFLRCKRSMEGVQGFINGALAEPWENQEARSARVELVARADAGGMDGAAPILTVDVQAVSPYFWVVVRQWAPSGHSRLMWAGHCDDWESIRRIQERFSVLDRMVVVDSGDRTAEVYENCLRWGERRPQGHASLPLWVGWLPSKGREREARWVDKRSGQPRPYHLGRASVPAGARVEVPLLEFSGDFLLGWLMRLRRGPDAAAGLRWEVVEMPTAGDIPGAVPVSGDEYFRHMDAKVHKPVSIGRTGRVEWTWKLRSQRWPDHLLDCELMQMAAALLQRRLPYAPQSA